MAPLCNIYSYRQRGERQGPVYHQHNSPREVRILQGVEYSDSNPTYMCPTCVVMHPAKPDIGLNVCLSDSMLHNFHQPRDPTVICPPDPFHVDWVTIPGGTIQDLTQAFTVDYWRQTRPMRIFVSAGLNNILRGASRNSMVEDYIHMKEVVQAQDAYHPNKRNELVIATLLNPPKLVWFAGNGPPPSNFHNHLGEIKELNSWLKFFNTQNGRICTPSFHRFGVRTTRGRIGGSGPVTSIQSHQFSQWRQSEQTRDMVHLNDRWRVRMGQAVLRHFEGEYQRNGLLDKDKE